MHGFQLWANLPASLKMTAPRYQDVQGKDIPEVVDDDGTRGAGRVRQRSGASADRSKASRPIRATSTSRCRPACASAAGRDVAPRVRVRLRRARARSAMRPTPRAVLTDIVGRRRASPDGVGNRSLVLFDRGDEVVVQAGDEGIRFLLVSGKPIEEPVAWYGPIVMNTQARAARGARRAQSRHVHQVAAACAGLPFGGPSVTPGAFAVGVMTAIGFDWTRGRRQVRPSPCHGHRRRRRPHHSRAGRRAAAVAADRDDARGLARALRAGGQRRASPHAA